MARISMRNISVEFPVYNLSTRSFKKHFIRLATGGTVLKNINQHIVVRSLSDITLSINHGDKIGLIGHNGSGKSTLLKLLARIYEPTHGDIYVEGKISPMLDLMQGIESEFTGYENILMRGTLLGFSRQQLKEHTNAIAEMTGLGDYLSMPIRTYSAGMLARLAFAISTSIKPDILLIDEIFAAGDADFIQKAYEKMISLVQQSSIVVIASHVDSLIRNFCNKALLLEGGCIKYFGSVDEALSIYHSKR